MTLQRHDLSQPSFFFPLTDNEVCQRDAPRLGDPAQVQDRQVSFSTLDGADEGAVQPARFGPSSPSRYSSPQKLRRAFRSRPASQQRD
jgi:hypothetical protein